MKNFLLGSTAARIIDKNLSCANLNGKYHSCICFIKNSFVQMNTSSQRGQYFFEPHGIEVQNHKQKCVPNNRNHIS